MNKLIPAARTGTFRNKNRLYHAAISLAIAGSLQPMAVFAVEDSGLFDLSLDQLTKVEIKSDITSIKAKSIREQPGIVSVVTAQQISETGARDLSEVLMQVPGFSLDTDVQSMVGLTFRGLQGPGRQSVARRGRN